MDLVLTRGEGIQNPKNLVGVICEWPLRLTNKLKEEDENKNR